MTVCPEPGPVRSKADPSHDLLSESAAKLKVRSGSTVFGDGPKSLASQRTHPRATHRGRREWP